MTYLEMKISKNEHLNEQFKSDLPQKTSLDLINLSITFIRNRIHTYEKIKPRNTRHNCKTNLAPFRI